MQYFILNAEESPLFQKEIAPYLKIIPILLSDGTYALPQTVLQYLPELQGRNLIDGSLVPFIIYSEDD
jgi:hypothetical protein